jgi:hypothetical protein
MEALSPVPESKLRIACLQMEAQVGKKARNVEQSLVMLANAARRGAQLAVLPELCNSGYVFATREEAFGVAEEVPNAPRAGLGRACRAAWHRDRRRPPSCSRAPAAWAQRGSRLDWTDITKPRPFGDAVTRC